jgi:cytochrome b561
MSTALSNDEIRYDGVARTLHWLVVILVLAQFLLGWTMPEVHHDTLPVGLIAWHLAVGSGLAVVMALRIVWRLTHAAPPDLTSPPLLRRAAAAGHGLLYLLLVAVPLLGWANASSRGWAVRAFEVLPLPALAQTGSKVAHAMGDIHSALAWVLLVLIVLHVAAALFHRLVLKDRVLQRMLP